MDICEEISRIEEECFDPAWNYEEIMFELDNPLCIGVWEQSDGKLAGYALARVIADEGELLRIAVTERFRRQGFAKKLMKRVLSDMKNRGAVVCFLEVRSKNSAAIALYESFGFQKISLRKHYYKDDDAVVMKKEL